MILEKTLESLLDWKEIQPVHPKGDQKEISPGCSLEGLITEAESLIFWLPDVKK